MPPLRVLENDKVVDSRGQGKEPIPPPLAANHEVREALHHHERSRNFITGGKKDGRRPHERFARHKVLNGGGTIMRACEKTP